LKPELLRNNMLLLHVAPETNLTRYLQKIINIVRVDKFETGYNYIFEDIIEMDITRIDFPDDYFDAVICNHVLEHIKDDILAIKELYRVLKPKGWGILQVPYSPILTKSIEEDTELNLQEREKKFGQKDHLRIYGLDYFERLSNIGFKVEKINFFKNNPDDYFKLGLIFNEEIIFVHK